MRTLVIRELPKQADDGCTHAAVDPSTGDVRAYGLFVAEVDLRPGTSTGALNFIVERVPTFPGDAN